ncbi:2,3-bisphosphoglycerate-independent phosphoglycerate mutase [Acidaminococcus massiliensis]|jgi:2,3-bisphosphoglycerate-independent phosphoglycerate mutase|uniref:2,3-bisphosphoglycerate-independent phosphoglycerate mutase n=1 Tax=Acidaminococcus massiliensis TaxID=1852375 RepID=UPI00248EF897|nr:2,3-bisphosphoglycerate-independent phosphoglycerate mutase [Acidaminococcus massiliensis]
MRKKPVMLMILDGWGIAPPSSTNAVTRARTPHLDYYFNRYPHSQLRCSGEAVGLPEGQMGNSEVGHLSIGSGRIIYQSLTRISRAVKDGSLEKNPVLVKAMEEARDGGKKLHLLGLLSDGGVHSHIDHLLGLLSMAQKMGVEKVCVHAFLDGRDTPPQSAAPFLEQVEKACKELGVGQIATVSGRYYAMDRDKRWERIRKVYDCMTGGEALEAPSAAEGLAAAYGAGQTDEFVVPFRVAGVDGKVEKGDSLIFFNFRPDRARELTHVFTDPEFAGFPRKETALPVHFVSMTEYEKGLQAAVAFPPEAIKDTLAEVVSRAGLHQLHIAETEKYAHVTFFFNGGREQPFPNEDRILVPSPKVATYDLQPEMSAYLVTEKLQEALAKDLYDLVILNFANPDMVGHTGSLEAAVKALEAVDECVGSLAETVLQKGGALCITADHGNLEEMEDPVTHAPMTAHTTNPVPFLVVGAEPGTQVEDGGLSDIAPTLLDLLDLPEPEAMTGHSLLLHK